MSLFNLGEFKLSSGGDSKFKIDCDYLTDGDWQALSALLVERLPPFDHVIGVPTGGYMLAQSMEKYCTEGSGVLLLVDDVLTTGVSITKMHVAWLADCFDTCGIGHYKNIIGAVIFARGPCPNWVVPLFQMKGIS